MNQCYAAGSNETGKAPHQTSDRGALPARRGMDAQESRRPSSGKSQHCDVSQISTDEDARFEDLR